MVNKNKEVKDSGSKQRHLGYYHTDLLNQKQT